MAVLIILGRRAPTANRSPTNAVHWSMRIRLRSRGVSPVISMPLLFHGRSKAWRRRKSPHDDSWKGRRDKCQFHRTYPLS